MGFTIIWETSDYDNFLAKNGVTSKALTLTLSMLSFIKTSQQGANSFKINCDGRQFAKFSKFYAETLLTMGVSSFVNSWKIYINSNWSVF